MWVTSSLETALTPTVVALGNFDGVHRGHQRVVQQILKGGNTAETNNVNNANLLSPEGKTYITVVTFNPHPQEFFTGKPRQLLTPPEEKVRHLLDLGVEQVVLLPFDRDMASLSPEQFVTHILVDKLRSHKVSVGEDFRFGQKRAGTTADLRAIAVNYGINVNILPLQTCEGERISSSFIRSSLQQGDVKAANRLLGRPYTLTGKVIPGQQLGRKLGFPTANLQLPAAKFLPKNGVYCVEISIENLSNDVSNLTYQIHPKPFSQTLYGVMNIGDRPTVNGSNQTVEVHLLDWSGDLYGQTLTVSLQEFLRSEQKFASLDALKAQIQLDCENAKKVLIGNG